MRLKAASGVILTFFLLSISLFALLVVSCRQVTAHYDPDLWLFRIAPDGSIIKRYVDDPEPPVKREDDLYTLTASTGNVLVQCSNIVLDGDGYDMLGGGGVMGL